MEFNLILCLIYTNSYPSTTGQSTRLNKYEIIASYN